MGHPGGHLAHDPEPLRAAHVRQHPVHRLDQVIELGAAADAGDFPRRERLRLGGQPLERARQGRRGHESHDQHERQTHGGDSRHGQHRAALLGRDHLGPVRHDELVLRTERRPVDVVALDRRPGSVIPDGLGPVGLLDEIEGALLQHAGLDGQEAGQILRLRLEPVLDRVGDLDGGDGGREDEGHQEQRQEREQDPAANAHPLPL